jgi:hypothetical protein
MDSGVLALLGITFFAAFVNGALAYGPMAFAILLDAWLLYAFFKGRRAAFAAA